MILVEAFLKAAGTNFMLHACTHGKTRLITVDNKAHVAILTFLIGAVYAVRYGNPTIATLNFGTQMSVAIITMVDIMAFTTVRTKEILVTHFVARLAKGLVNAVTTIAAMMIPETAMISTVGAIATVLAEVFGNLFF